MLITIRDPAGRIEGCCEVQLVNQHGVIDPAHGYAVWVERLEISRGCEGKRVMREMMLEVLDRQPRAEYMYFRRWQKNWKHEYRFTRSQVESYVAKEVRV